MRLIFSILPAASLLTTAAQGITQEQYIARVKQIDAELNAARATHDNALRYAAGDPATIAEVDEQFRENRDQLQKEKTDLNTQWANAVMREEAASSARQTRPQRRLDTSILYSTGLRQRSASSVSAALPSGHGVQEVTR